MYVKNITNSVGYMIKDIGKEIMPNLYDSKDSIRAVVKAVKEFDSVSAVKKVHHSIVNSSVVAHMHEFNDNLIKGLKTGEIYKEASETDGEFEDFDFDSLDDMFTDDDDDDDPSDPSTKLKNDKRNSKAIIEGNKAATNTVIKSGVENTATLIAAFEKTLTTTMATSESRNSVRHAELTGVLKSMNDNLASMVKFNNDVMRKYVEKSTKFYDSQDKMIAELNREMVDFREESMSKIYSKQGLKGFVKEGKNRLMEHSMFGGMGDMLSQMAMQYVTNPGALGRDAIKGLLDGKFGILRKGKRLDKLFKGFGNASQDIFRRMSGSNNGLLSYIGETLRDKNDLTISTSVINHEKEAKFSNVTKASIEKVIPTYLRKILAELNGKEEMVFDYSIGKFTTRDKIKSMLESRLDPAVSSVSGSFVKSVSKGLKQNGVEQIDTKKLEELLKNVVKALSGNGFDLNSFLSSGVDGYEKLIGSGVLNETEYYEIRRVLMDMKTSDNQATRREYEALNTTIFRNIRARAETIKTLHRQMEFSGINSLLDDSDDDESKRLTDFSLTDTQTTLNTEGAKDAFKVKRSKEYREAQATYGLLDAYRGEAVALIKDLEGKKGVIGNKLMDEKGIYGGQDSTANAFVKKFGFKGSEVDVDDIDEDDVKDKYGLGAEESVATYSKFKFKDNTSVADTGCGLIAGINAISVVIGSKLSISAHVKLADKYHVDGDGIKPAFFTELGRMYKIPVEIYNGNVDVKTLKKMISSGDGIVSMVRTTTTKHYIAITGINGDSVIINDPWDKSNTSMPLSVLSYKSLILIVFKKVNTDSKVIASVDSIDDTGAELGTENELKFGQGDGEAKGLMGDIRSTIKATAKHDGTSGTSGKLKGISNNILMAISYSTEYMRRMYARDHGGLGSGEMPKLDYSMFQSPKGMLKRLGGAGKKAIGKGFDVGRGIGRFGFNTTKGMLGKIGSVGGSGLKGLAGGIIPGIGMAGRGIMSGVKGAGAAINGIAPGLFKGGKGIFKGAGAALGGIGAGLGAMAFGKGDKKGVISRLGSAIPGVTSNLYKGGKVLLKDGNALLGSVAKKGLSAAKGVGKFITDNPLGRLGGMIKGSVKFVGRKMGFSKSAKSRGLKMMHKDGKDVDVQKVWLAGGYLDSLGSVGRVGALGTVSDTMFNKMKKVDPEKFKLKLKKGASNLSDKIKGKLGRNSNKLNIFAKTKKNDDEDDDREESGGLLGKIGGVAAGFAAIKGFGKKVAGKLGKKGGKTAIKTAEKAGGKGITALIKKGISKLSSSLVKLVTASPISKLMGKKLKKKLQSKVIPALMKVIGKSANKAGPKMIAKAAVKQGASTFSLGLATAVLGGASGVYGAVQGWFKAQDYFKGKKIGVKEKAVAALVTGVKHFAEWIPVVGLGLMFLDDQTLVETAYSVLGMDDEVETDTPANKNLDVTGDGSEYKVSDVPVKDTVKKLKVKSVSNNSVKKDEPKYKTITKSKMEYHVDGKGGASGVIEDILVSINKGKFGEDINNRGGFIYAFHMIRKTVPFYPTALTDKSLGDNVTVIGYHHVQDFAKIKAKYGVAYQSYYYTVLNNKDALNLLMGDTKRLDIALKSDSNIGKVYTTMDEIHKAGLIFLALTTSVAEISSNKTLLEAIKKKDKDAIMNAVNHTRIGLKDHKIATNIIGLLTVKLTSKKTTYEETVPVKIPKKGSVGGSKPVPKSKDDSTYKQGRSNTGKKSVAKVKDRTDYINKLIMKSDKTQGVGNHKEYAIALQSIAKHEGFVNHVYKDSLGIPTIGYGFNIGTPAQRKLYGEDNVRRWEREGITKAEADGILLNMIKRTAKREETGKTIGPVYRKLDPMGKAGLIDFGFNIGTGGVAKFKNTLKAIDRGDKDAVARGIKNSRYARQVGSRADDVIAMLTMHMQENNKKMDELHDTVKNHLNVAKDTHNAIKDGNKKDPFAKPANQVPVV